MKTLLISTTALLLSIGMSAQITVSKHDIKTSCDVSKIADFEAVTATSTCGEVTTEIKDTMFSGGCLGTLSRSYVFTDECGNKQKAEQYILLKDFEAPKFVSIPEDIKVVGADKVPKATTMAATDNVGDDEVTIVFTESEEKNKIMRQWVATDGCGNKTTANQVITVKKK